MNKVKLINMTKLAAKKLIIKLKGSLKEYDPTIMSIPKNRKKPDTKV
ncbi:MAG: hypothetical protein HN417_06450 [Desulfobacula sp.]|nr:hypothetical protein [Desulfobacula sp.]MBT6339897.1 hypothetical protein [Desulfobacula sp.]MBT7261131.1 hypothetical protein [Desulfobacula sp.]